MKTVVIALLLALAVIGVFLLSDEIPFLDDSSSAAQDPGARDGAASVGAPLAGLSTTEHAFFIAGKDEFEEDENVADGLGPTMNLGSCSGCHLQPAVGGTSPAVNPQVEFATANGATNAVPSFITLMGPVREARFVRNPDGSPDSGVHDLFTIAGRSDAPGCTLAQPDFQRELARRNVIFRIPTPLFGAGLIEHIPDKMILANRAFGIAVYDKLAAEEFNPNVSFELGYMIALHKPVLIFLDEEIPSLFADIAAKLYEPFEPLSGLESIPSAVERFVRARGLI
jgi:hypothetical protein